MSSVPVPYALPVVSSWSIVDWLDESYSATAGADGVATITLDVLPDNTRWQLTHVVEGAVTVSKPVMRLYLDAVSNAGLRDGSSSGAFDVADWAMGLMVPPNRALIARWTGCNPGDAVFLNLQANILRRSS